MECHAFSLAGNDTNKDYIMIVLQDAEALGSMQFCGTDLEEHYLSIEPRASEYNFEFDFFSDATDRLIKTTTESGNNTCTWLRQRQVEL